MAVRKVMGWNNNYRLFFSLSLKEEFVLGVTTPSWHGQTCLSRNCRIPRTVICTVQGFFQICPKEAVPKKKIHEKVTMVGRVPTTWLGYDSVDKPTRRQPHKTRTTTTKRRDTDMEFPQQQPRIAIGGCLRNIAIVVFVLLGFALGSFSASIGSIVAAEDLRAKNKTSAEELHHDGLSQRDNVNDLTWGNTLQLMNEKNKNWTLVPEFVHITKTGGSAIEFAASRAGIAWGSCKFMRKFNCVHPNLTGVPIINNRAMSRKVSALHSYYRESPLTWHIPHHFFHTPIWNPAIPTFTVVRHPYSRAVSFYYCKWNGYKGNGNISSPAVLNDWLQRILPTVATKSTVGLLPQHVYVLDGDKRMVDYILHFETLDQDFRTLMQKYHLGDKIHLPPMGQVNQGRYSTQNNSSRLTERDLTPKTLAMIDAIFGAEFFLFGYQKNDTTSWSGGMPTGL